MELHRPKAVFLTSPNNPDGSLIAEADLLAVLRLPVLVVLDEAYIEFAEEPSRMDWVQRHDNLVVLRTFSKSAGLAGIRVSGIVSGAFWGLTCGWLLGRCRWHCCTAWVERHDKLVVLHTSNDMVVSAGIWVGSLVTVFSGTFSDYLVRQLAIWSGLGGLAVGVDDPHAALLCTKSLRGGPAHL